jgi:hypothetical protein
VALAGIPIGQLLVEQGVLTAKQVAHIVEVQRLSHRPFGDLAERLYGVSPEAIEDAWVTQYIREAGLTDLRGVEVDEQCLKLVNRRQAWQFYLLPIGRDEQALTVVTDADHLVRAVNFSSRRLAEPVYFVLADRRQLREFMMKYFPVPEHMAEYAEKL